MPHAYWHIIECGSVGSTVGEPVSPGQWRKTSHGIVVYKAANEKLETILRSHSSRIANIIGELTGGHVHKLLDLGGGYYGFGIGRIEGPVDIPPLQQYSDAFLSVIYEAPDVSEAAAGEAYARITIERAKAYLKVYQQTGGVITFSYGIHSGE